MNIWVVSILLLFGMFFFIYWFNYTIFYCECGFEFSFAAFKVIL